MTIKALKAAAKVMSELPLGDAHRENDPRFNAFQNTLPSR